jgi:hypothetical protein
MNRLELPIRAATETAIAHGITPDRCEILQDASTLVLRLTDSLVARVVNDSDGPRKGLAWFTRENAVAEHMTRHGAPVIPLHPDIPPGPHERFGFPLNFWKFVTAIDAAPAPREIGRTLHQCHEILREFSQPLDTLAIISESIELLAMLSQRELFPKDTIEMLRGHLTASKQVLSGFPHQPLHGDAHPGNYIHTTSGLLWTDWEDTFSGPIEWDVASIIWNAKILDEDHCTADGILDAYRNAGGEIDADALEQSIIARGAVMTAWYPVLYPKPNTERQRRLKLRLDWLWEKAG